MARYWEWDAPFTIHPEETALLIIDMQTGFTQPDGPLYTPQSAEQLPTIADLKKLLAAYRSGLVRTPSRME